MEVTPIVKLVYNFFLYNKEHSYDFKEIREHFKKNHPAISSLLLLETVTNLYQEDYIVVANKSYNSFALYKFNKPLEEKKMKIKINFHAGSNN